LQNEIERKAKNDVIKKTKLEDGMKKKKKELCGIVIDESSWPDFLLNSNSKLTRKDVSLHDSVNLRSLKRTQLTCKRMIWLKKNQNDIFLILRWQYIGNWGFAS